MDKRIHRIFLKTLLGIFIFFGYLMLCSGETRKKVEYGIGGGYCSFQSGENNQGFLVRFTVGREIVKNVDLNVGLVYYSLPVKEEADGLSEGILSLFPLQLDLKYRIIKEGTLLPYFGAGVGYYFSSFSPEVARDWEILGYEISEKLNGYLALQVILGSDLKIAENVNLSFETRYSLGSTTGNSFMKDMISEVTVEHSFKKSMNHFMLILGLNFLTWGQE